MSEIFELRRARGYAKAKMTRLRNQVLQAASESGGGFDKEQAETRLEKLEQICTDFEAIQAKLLKLGEFAEDDTAEEEIFEDRYFELKTLLKRVVRQTSTEGAQASQNTDTIVQLLQHQTELMQNLIAAHKMTLLPPWRHHGLQAKTKP